MIQLLTQYITVSVVSVIIDLLWLGVIAKNLYAQEIGPLMRKSFMVAPAILVYVAIPLLIVFFAIPKTINKGPIETFFWSGLLGACVYAVYDLTNLATLKGWSTKMTIIDIVWGAVLFGSVTLIATKVILPLISQN